MIDRRVNLSQQSLSLDQRHPIYPDCPRASVTRPCARFLPSSVRNHMEGVFVVSSPTGQGLSFAFSLPRSRPTLPVVIRPDCRKCLLKVSAILRPESSSTAMISFTTYSSHKAFSAVFHSCAFSAKSKQWIKWLAGPSGNEKATRFHRARSESFGKGDVTRGNAKIAANSGGFIPLGKPSRQAGFSGDPKVAIRAHDIEPELLPTETQLVGEHVISPSPTPLNH
jgi:hypothetical protein